MRIAFFTPYPKEGASTRFRVHQYLPFLEASGLVCDVFPFLKSEMYKYLFLDRKKTRRLLYYLTSLLNRRTDLKKIENHDLVFVQLNVCPIGMYFEKLLMLMNKPIIFDFDDAEFITYDSAINWWSMLLKDRAKMSKMIQMSHTVIAGNAYLAEFARKYNDNVFIMPTCLDTAKYRPGKRIKKDKITIGWMGSSASSRYLPLLDETFTRLLTKYDNLKIVVIGSTNYHAPDARIILKPWSLKTEISDLQELDVGLMPLTSSEYSKGKCGFKALQYMSTGAVPVVSPVGVNTDIVRDGVNGFVADGSEEWVEKIGLLVENVRLRQKMARAARRTVEASYSVDGHREMLLSLIKNLAKNESTVTEEEPGEWGVRRRC